MPYRISPQAAGDLDDIFDYWAARASPEVAERLLDNIGQRLLLVGHHPQSGRACDAIAAGVRCLSAGKYLIYYRIAPRRRIDILRILQRARDQRKVFRTKNL